MGNKRSLLRLGLAVLIAISLVGCRPTTGVPPVSTSPAPRGTLTTALPTASTSATPRGTAGPSDLATGCPPDLPAILVDEQLRYRLCMPDEWRDLGFDRSAWIEAFGDEVTQLETAVRSGNLDHVAVPLSPAGNNDFASLVIDSPELDASDTLEERRDAFLDANVELGADLLSSEIVDLDGVRAARAALDVSNMEGSTRDGLLILYLVPMSSDLLFLRFTSDAETAGEYESIFDAMAETFEVEDAAT